MRSTCGGKKHGRTAGWAFAAWAVLLLFFIDPALADDSWRGGFGGNGPSGPVYALAVNQTTGEVYAGGDFTSAGGQAANHVARWDGASWSAVGSGASNGTNGIVYALTVDSRGVLWAGGSFTVAGSVTVGPVATWNGTNWSAVTPSSIFADPYLRGTVYALAAGQDGVVYVGGNLSVKLPILGWVFMDVLKAQNGEFVLTSFLNELSHSPTVYALAVDSSGDTYVGGTSTGVGPALAKFHEGSGASSVGGGVWSGSSAGTVRALALDGAGRLYVGGQFTKAGAVDAQNVAVWDTTAQTWAALGAGLTGGTAPCVYALGVDAAGTVYAGGTFTTAGGNAASNIAKWDGSAWYALGSGTDAGVNALAVAGTGHFFAGGTFTSAGGQAAAGFAEYREPPTVSGISPSHGPATLSTVVTLSGAYFVGTPGVTFGGTPATGISAAATQIICTAPTHAAGTVTVVVTNPDGLTGSASYYYDPLPTVAAISPSIGPDVGGAAVTISGTGFLAGASVDFGGSAATGISVDTSTQITCTTSSHVLATVRVTVTNPDAQSGFRESAYTYVNAAPLVQSEPWAAPAMVVLPATSTLRVVAHDPDNAPQALTYAWEEVTGPGPVYFSANGTADASTTTASFGARGTYALRVSISDGAATVVSSSVVVIAEVPFITPTLKGDLDGDGRPDILLQNYAAGTFTVWPMNGSGSYATAKALMSGGTPVALGPDSGGWTLAGCGDFNNDGQQDLVFQNLAAGQIQIWLLHEFTVATILPLRNQDGSVVNLGANSGGWQVAAVDDFNGDGRPELLLQNYATGELAVWTIGGASCTGSLAITNSGGQAMSLGANSGGWRVVGSGDFNRDGKPDLLFQNTASGTFCVWLLNRTVFSSSSWLTNNGSPLNLGANSGGWTVGACADYTSDGKCDIVLQNAASGAVTLWALDGARYTNSITVRGGVNAPVTLGANSGGWIIGGCGDINGEGQAEIFWQHAASGCLSAWTTSGGYYTGSLSITNASGQAVGLGANSGGWRAAGFADFNRDGKQDLLLQNDAAGLVCVWFLNGAKFSSSAMITTSSGQALSLGTNSGGWRVVGAADLNGDGKPDLLLQNDAQGLLNIWWLNGTVFTGGSYVTDSSHNIVNLGTNSAGWRAAACGDFNADGKTDIVLQHDAAGLLNVWLLNGSTLVTITTFRDAHGGTMGLGVDSAGWRLRGYGDINGDGKCELLWQHPATGYTSMWTLNGLLYTGGGMILDPHGAPVNLGTNSGGWGLCAPR